MPQLARNGDPRNTDHQPVSGKGIPNVLRSPCHGPDPLVSTGPASGRGSPPSFFVASISIHRLGVEGLPEGRLRREGTHRVGEALLFFLLQRKGQPHPHVQGSGRTSDQNGPPLPGLADCTTPGTGPALPFCSLAASPAHSLLGPEFPLPALPAEIFCHLRPNYTLSSPMRFP